MTGNRTPGLLLPALMMAAGCASFNQPMAVPGDLATQAQPAQVTEDMDSSGRTRLHFDRYTISKIAWGPQTSGEGFKFKVMFVKSRDTKVGSYSYDFEQRPGQAGAGAMTGPLQARCGTVDGQQVRPLPIGEVVSPISRLECRCAGAGHSAEAVVELNDKGEWAGKLAASGGGYDLLPVTQLQNGKQALDVRGYSVHGPQNVALGAVETTAYGKVWLSPALDEKARTEVACVFAGLMLYEEQKQQAAAP